MPLSSAEAFAPATVANLGVGFDILGLAVDGAGDSVRAELTDTPGVSIREITGDGGKLPRDPLKNTASIAAASVLKAVNAVQGVALIIHKGLPLASGLGSSAASAVAGAAAANAVLGEPLTRDQLLEHALEGEAAVSGYHADNVAPCLYGGITLSYGIKSHEITRLPVPAGLYLALITPRIAVPTAKARAVLPATVPLKTMVKQTAGVARLISAIYRGDIAQMAAAMETDSVVEPARSHLIPQIAEARALAKEAGALALVISGAGPTLCAVCDHVDAANLTMMAVTALYDDAGIGADSRLGSVLESGAYVR
ncbi:MAG: homoserine kinase [Anaerolineae bacterium]|nr:homoserine kinase [Anaerolineae bacterium]